MTTKDNLCKVADLFRHLSTQAEREETGRKMYKAAYAVAPRWEQLGEATKGLWHDVAAIQLAGHPFHLWYSDEDYERLKDSL